jgi:D-glycero-D-manno-heptose 1,7-bisphosphate phosphatase
MVDSRSKAVFLDRDQTLIHDPGYINHPDQVTLIEGVPEALHELRALGYLLVVVTNQSAVARGIVTEAVLQEIHGRMEALLAERGARLDRIYYCPFHPEGVIDKYRRPSDSRKPNPGMLLKAAEEMDIDLAQSWCLGDSFKDVEAGVRAGCRTILIDGSSPPKRPSPGQPSPDYVAVNFREAVNIIKKFHRDSVMDSPQTKPEIVHTNKPAANRQTPMDQPVVPMTLTAAVPAKAPAGPTQTPKMSPAPAEMDDLPADDRTEQLLEGILGQLRDMHRSTAAEDLSVMRILAGITQMLSLACLVAAIWKLTALQVVYNQVFAALGFATVLQIMALTFYTMNRR